MSDDAEARKQRAARLRERVAEVTGRPTGSGADAPAAPDPAARRNAPRVNPQSPRSFVEERMRDLDQGKNETKH